MFFSSTRCIGRAKTVGTALCAAVALLSALCIVGYSQPASQRPPVLRDVNIDQLLNNQVPLDLEFRDETGKTVRLQDYFKDKPVILSLVYFDCPQLCTMELTGLLGCFKTLPMMAGRDFVSLTVSFDPREKPELARAKKEEYIRRLAKPDAAGGWHFLTGEEAQIEALARSVGFRFVWDPVTKQYAHSSGIIILTPQGKVSRYFFGIEYAPRDVRFGLIDASQDKIGSLADQIILYCYQYDPERGTYGLVMTRLLRIFGGVTVVTLVALILFLRRKDKQKQAEWARTAGQGTVLPRAN
ncbi:MAG: SCO family protein [Blastocatellia bacterium]|nr:SCO family protein [Blastocatellia bacterium]